MVLLALRVPPDEVPAPAALMPATPLVDQIHPSCQPVRAACAQLFVPLGPALFRLQLGGDYAGPQSTVTLLERLGNLVDQSSLLLRFVG